MAKKKEKKPVKLVSAKEISSRAMRYAIKFRSSKKVIEKLNLNAALSLLSIAQNMTPADANKLINTAETLIR